MTSAAECKRLRAAIASVLTVELPCDVESELRRALNTPSRANQRAQRRAHMTDLEHGIRIPREESVTAENAESFGEFGQFRKTAISYISTFTVAPGTTFETPEGLKAEDEAARIAFDAQGGVYPIRESVFQATYAPAET